MSANNKQDGLYNYINIILVNRLNKLQPDFFQPQGANTVVLGFVLHDEHAPTLLLRQAGVTRVDGDR